MLEIVQGPFYKAIDVENVAYFESGGDVRGSDGTKYVLIMYRTGGTIRLGDLQPEVVESIRVKAVADMKSREPKVYVKAEAKAEVVEVPVQDELPLYTPEPKPVPKPTPSPAKVK